MKLLFTEYTRTQCRDLFGGQVVSPVLPYSYKRECLAGCDEEAPGSVSVSGAQQKMAVVAEAGRLRFAREGETGTHILKPSPQRFALSRDIPANEALCMRICRELFRLPTAASALCFFSDGVPAYLTRRFDLMPMGGKAHMEDFASLSNMEMHGSSNRKYHGSYEQLAEVLKSCSTTPLLDLRRFFCMVLANYLLCNGDAHAKNFSMIEDVNGGFTLAPAYDVMNTAVHVNDSPFAMSLGLFADGRTAEKKRVRDHFLAWGGLIGLSQKIAALDLNMMLQQQKRIEALIADSFLSQKAQRVFLYHSRLRFAQFL